MSNVFVCADLHFSHKNIIKYENRPFADIHDMNKQLVRNWNRVVCPNDTVYVLGDVSFAGNRITRELVTKLNGHKILIMGNHDRDRSVQKWVDIGFEWVSPHPIIINEYVVLMHEPPTYFNSACPYFYVYGHVHGTPDYQSHTETSACVSIERLNYAPALLNDVLTGEAYINGKELSESDVKKILEAFRPHGSPDHS